jgi:acetyl esterase/lipase
VPGASVEQQAADVAAAVRSLLDRAGDLGIDPSKVVLMGHSAGAHLVALVGTDEHYLRSAGLSLRILNGVIPIDGAAYDVPQQLADAGPRMRQTYTAAFGTDPARQRRLSPTMHAAAPNAAAFLLPHVQRRDGVRQSNELAAALNAAGTPAETASIPGQGLLGHMEINRKLGQADYPATAVVDAWLKRIFAD